MTTNLKEYKKEELERSIEVHEKLIRDSQQVDLDKLPDFDRKSIVDAIAKKRDWLKKLYDELSRR